MGRTSTGRRANPRARPSSLRPGQTPQPSTRGTEPSRRLAGQAPPFWTHEDAAIGYLLFHAAVAQALPLTYVVLSSWAHNKFWINWFPRDNPSLPDEHVVNTHKVVTPMMAQIALDAYDNSSYSADPIECVDCKSVWGWSAYAPPSFGEVPVRKFGCCNKALDRMHMSMKEGAAAVWGRRRGRRRLSPRPG